MSDNIELLDCPLCDFTVLPTNTYVLQLHFEQIHTENSPFVVKDDPEPLPSFGSSSKHDHVQGTTSSDEDENAVACPELGCGELVLLHDLNDHLDLHVAETLSFDETTKKYRSHHSSHSMHKSAATHHSHRRSSRAATSDYRCNTESPDVSKSDSHGKSRRRHRERRNSGSSEKSTLARSISSFNPFSKDKSAKPPKKSARLGQDELGFYAFEEHMPRWLHNQLAAGPKISIVNRVGRDGRLIKQEMVQNETPGVIPILAQLSALDRTVREAYYCHPSTIHVGKTPNEGSFCGYRNIQMLVSYIQGARAQGHEEFPGRLPGILKLQDLIEQAWDKGINDVARIQTGGVRDTRKYIGTPEAQAIFLSSEINCAVEMFSDKDTPKGKVQAHDLLLLAVERYFAQAAVNDGSNVHKTLLPPIYLQRPGHSLTVVGFERRSDSYCNLVVLDPVYTTSPAMHQLIGRRNIKSARPEVMHAYRRGPACLKKYAAFEILLLTATPPLFPAWDVLRQFPDCSFAYAFFRARTLGYDVYPEDYFLSNFPWQQYGGLWIVDEARFARAAPVDALTCQALRRITGEGASNPTSDSGSPTSYFTNSTFGHQPGTLADLQSNTRRQAPDIPAFDGCASDVLSFDHGHNQPMFNVGGLSKALRPDLTLLTDVGRKYPGFPSPLSPTLTAKDLYPTPTSDTGSEAVVPHFISPAVRSLSPMSIDGSSMCGPSTRCVSHGYDHYARQMGLIDNVLAQSATRPSSRALSASPLSPTGIMSPPRALSPRIDMLRNIAAKQALHNYHGSAFPSSTGPQFSPQASHVRRDSGFSYDASPAAFYSQSVRSLSPHPSPGQNAFVALPSIQIANGTEFETGSPISPTGTMLSYTSNRAVDSGLLALPALSEPQVAEYRFWVPCGRRVCAFGCGGGHEGESAAAKRLFREENGVLEQRSVGDEGYGYGEGEDSFEETFASTGREDVRSNEITALEKSKRAEEWKRFLHWRDRDVSVAKV